LGGKKAEVDVIKALEEVGITRLVDGHRQNILIAFNKFQDNWYTPEMLNQVLGVSKQYAYKICEGLTLTRIVEKRKLGNKSYYRYRKEERLGQ